MHNVPKVCVTEQILLEISTLTSLVTEGTWSITYHFDIGMWGVQLSFQNNPARNVESQKQLRNILN